MDWGDEREARGVRSREVGKSESQTGESESENKKSVKIMIASIVGLLKDKMVEMPWIDKYAGMSRVVSRDARSPKSGDGKSVNSMETFPISWNTDVSKCWDNGDYMDLMPNDKYKSVVYWEDLSGLVKSGSVDMSGNRSLAKYDANVRMIAWINSKKLGYTSGEEISELMQDAINKLNGMLLKKVDAPVALRTMEVSLNGIPMKDHRVIFGKYSYGQRDDLFMYPYDYFAIDWKIRVVMDGKCGENVGVRGEVAC